MNSEALAITFCNLLQCLSFIFLQQKISFQTINLKVKSQNHNTIIIVIFHVQKCKEQKFSTIYPKTYTTNLQLHTKLKMLYPNKHTHINQYHSQSQRLIEKISSSCRKWPWRLTACSRRGVGEPFLERTKDKGLVVKS